MIIKKGPVVNSMPLIRAVFESDNVDESVVTIEDVLEEMGR